MSDTRKNNQLSRYGAIAKAAPFTTGKTFFLVSSSEYAVSPFLDQYPPDGDGVSRVYTTWASVISAAQSTVDSATVIVSPLFTTAPTLAQIQALKAAKTQTIQAGNSLPDGSYLATKANVSIASASNQDVFTVTGKVNISELFGEVETTIGTVTGGAKFTLIPTVGSSTDMCATGDITALAVGGSFSLTGTLANTMVASVQGARIDQATSLVVKAGTIRLTAGMTSTGNVRTSVVYSPLEPGALVFPA